jgi:hypothetical protein
MTEVRKVFDFALGVRDSIYGRSGIFLAAPSSKLACGLPQV